MFADPLALRLELATSVLIAHEVCYMLWREESVLFLTPRRP
jgi:hypothetical protein